MGKGKDAKKSTKKAPAKTAKEKKAEKRLKKAKQKRITYSRNKKFCYAFLFLVVLHEKSIYKSAIQLLDENIKNIQLVNYHLSYY